jgi:hypothetical protein
MKKQNLIIGLIVAAVLCTGLPNAFAKANHYTIAPTGTLKIKNRSDLPFQLYIDGEFIAKSKPGDKIVLNHMPIGKHTVRAHYPGKMPVPDQLFTPTVRMDAVSVIRLTSSRGRLKVTNANPFPIMLKVRGKEIRRIGPNQTRTIHNLTPGRAHVALVGPGGSSLNQVVQIQRGKITPWSPGKLLAEISLKNPTGRAMRVFLDGNFVGWIQARATRRFTGLTPGKHHVRLSAFGVPPIQATVQAQVGRPIRVVLAQPTPRVRQHPNRATVFVPYSSY